jgi:hypothetical protein
VNLRDHPNAFQHVAAFHDGSAATTVLSGNVLMQTGITVALPLPDSSELVLVESL